MDFQNRLNQLRQRHEELINLPNTPIYVNGVYERYTNPVITAAHAPLEWRYDFDPQDNPYLVERIGIHAAFNSGAIKIGDEYIMVVRVEADDRKSFFAVARSKKPTEGFRFDPRPITMPEYGEPATNVYDMRLTLHEDGWIYGLFCVERKDHSMPGDLSAATAACGIARTHDLVNWERLADLQCKAQQRNVVLHPEFVDGKYALYTRSQDGFIDVGGGGGIGWALVDDITAARVDSETILSSRAYHTVMEVKNGEGPAPIKTEKGWLHLAHAVRGCASGLRYVLYMYMTALDDPAKVIAEPAGFFIAPEGEEYIGDVMNVVFTNGWIQDGEDVYIYYASSDTRMHVAHSTIDRLVDYCMNTEKDGQRTGLTVERINRLIDKNLNNK